MSEDVKLIEYRVKPVTRYIVTRYEERADSRNHMTSDDPRIAENRIGSASVCGRGEFESAETAYEIGYALAKADHERMGWPLGDERIQYPRYPMAEDVESPREVSSQEFRVTVDGVLDGARDLIEVAVIGIADDGAVHVASSMGTPQTIALFAQARPQIEALREE